MNSTSAALAGIAANMSAREAQHVTQVVDEEQTGGHVTGVPGAVNGYGDAGHQSYLRRNIFLSD
jgi:hypothetical protein